MLKKSHPRKKATTTPNRVSAVLETKNADYVRKKMKEKGSIKTVLDEALDHVRECTKSV